MHGGTRDTLKVIVFRLTPICRMCVYCVTPVGYSRFIRFILRGELDLTRESVACAWREIFLSDKTEKDRDAYMSAVHGCRIALFISYLAEREWYVKGREHNEKREGFKKRTEKST